MSTIAVLTSGENGANSLIDINANFSALNTDKIEGTGSADNALVKYSGTGKNIKGETGSGYVKVASGIVALQSSIAETDISFTDVATGNASSTKHGFLPKTSANSTQFLNGGTGPAFAAVKDSDLALTDITTNDVSTGRHGFVPKLSGATNTFYRNDGTFAAPLNAKTVLGRNVPTTGSAGNIRYIQIVGSETAGVTPEPFGTIIPFSGTIRNLYIRSGATMSSTSTVYTVRKNGVDTAITISFASSDTNTTKSDTTHSFTVVAGDYITIGETSTGTGNPICNAISIELDAT